MHRTLPMLNPLTLASSVLYIYPFIFLLLHRLCWEQCSTSGKQSTELLHQVHSNWLEVYTNTFRVLSMNFMYWQKFPQQKHINNPPELTHLVIDNISDTIAQVAFDAWKLPRNDHDNSSEAKIMCKSQLNGFMTQLFKSRREVKQSCSTSQYHVGDSEPTLTAQA